MRFELGNSCVVVHLTLVPYLAAAEELKTKPTQHSVKTMLEAGVQPDIIVARSEKHLGENIRQKISLFCNVPISSVKASIDAESIYDVPLLMREEKLDEEILKKTGMPLANFPDLTNWERFLKKLKNPKGKVQIGLIGKYVELKDAYKSILESFIHAGAENEFAVDVKSIHSERITDVNAAEILDGLSGILVAPGFGERGIEGKISAIRWARENKVPFFGICLGMQCAVVEFGRNVLGFDDAHSTEFNDKTAYPVIDLMEEQKEVDNKGGTMRLGAYPCRISKDSMAYSIYKEEDIRERHRHRYEFNNKFLDKYKNAGMLPVGINPNENLVEMMEIPDHPWFVGVQFHPEYKSTVARPHPLFVSFVKACIKHSEA
jgi:CTP synthase